MTSSRMVKAGIGLAVVGLLASACGSSDDGGGDNNGVESSFNAAIDKVVNVSDKKGGTLRLGAAEDFDSLDPQRTYYGYVWNFRRLWDRQMFQFKPVPGQEGLQLVPDLTTDLGSSSADKKTWTYHIKSGVKFSNGSPVTSKNIKYGIERLWAQDVINGGPTYLVDLLGGSASYPGPYKDKSADHLGLKTIETPDDTTIIFKLTKPFSDMNYVLALPSSTPVPIDVDQNSATGGDNYKKHPISSGPYQVDSYQPGKSVHLVRNKYWSADNDPNHKALVDDVQVTIGTAADTLDQQILAGQIDYALDSPIQTNARSQILSDKTGKGKFADNPVLAFTTQWIDVNRVVIPNVHCRRAVAYALDKKSLQSVYGGEEVGGLIANTVIPPSSTSYEKDYNPYPSGADGTGDIAKAKEELKLCGKPNGFKTKIAARKTGFGPKVALSVQNALKRVGIQATYIPTTRATDPAKVPAQVHSQGIGLISFNWGADFPTDFGFWDYVADPRIIPPAGNYNEGEFNDPKGSELIDKALTQTGEEQIKTWREFSHLVMDSATMIPYLFPKQMQAHSSRLTNVYCFYPFFNEYDLMNVGVVS